MLTVLKKGIIVFLILIIFLIKSAFPQTQDSLTISSYSFYQSKIDTNRLLSDVPLKSPMGAVLRSAIMPGWGQVYNQQYLKAGIAFTVNATMIFQIFRYHKRWKDTAIKDFQGKRNLYTWYFALTYILTLVDAYVDAYLYKFDEAMEISHDFQLMEGKWVAEVRFSLYF